MKKKFHDTPKLLTCRPANLKMTLGIKLVGRRINYFFWFFCWLQLGVFSFDCVYAAVSGGSASPISSNERLRRTRAKLEGHPVDVTINDEIEAVLQTVLKTDPISLQEALAQAYDLGLEFRQKPPTAFEARRAILREVIAHTIKLETFPERVERWFRKRPFSNFLFRDTSVLVLGVAAVDIAVARYPGEIQGMISAAIIALNAVVVGWLPILGYAHFSRTHKFNAVFESFALGANLSGRGARFRSVARALNYPDGFVGCARALRNLPAPH